MKTLVQLKKPYGQASFARVKSARYLGWEDAFEVEFSDGLCFLEPQSAVKTANRISAKAIPVSVEVDDDLGSHFKVTYDTGESAEVSWSFIRELPPVPTAKVAETPVQYRTERRPTKFKKI